MTYIKVRLKHRSYNIVIGNNILPQLGKFIKQLDIGSDAYVVTNNLIKNRYAASIKKALAKPGFSVRIKTVPDTEKSKSIEVALRSLRDIAAYDKKRRVFIVAFGGGVIGDLAGFVAAIYKRGIPYVQVPTTFLAQIDSSIGGKTAVDLRTGKNLVGAFYQPKMVFSDIRLMLSLTRQQIRNGLAEAIKYGLIKDKQLFLYLERNYKNILSRHLKSLEYVVKRCSAIKARIVGSDERERRNIRTCLNFGHTLGHAIEASGNYQAYSHGEAVALGMLLACDISRELNLIVDKQLPARLENLIRIVGLPTKLKMVSLRKIIKTHYYDKKFKGGSNRFVLIRNFGHTQITSNVPLEIIRGVLKKRLT